MRIRPTRSLEELTARALLRLESARTAMAKKPKRPPPPKPEPPAMRPGPALASRWRMAWRTSGPHEWTAVEYRPTGSEIYRGVRALGGRLVYVWQIPDGTYRAQVQAQAES